jgi:hypothetical protein
MIALRVPVIDAPAWVPFGTMHDGPASALVFRSAWGLQAIVSVAPEADGKIWEHVSVSHAERIPAWRELAEVRRVFVPADLVALQVLPPEAEWVNDHPYTLHLWACLNGRVTPDFRTHRGSI